MESIPDGRYNADAPKSEALLRQCLQLVALGAYQLEHVGILLVRHYAAARGTFLGQADEGEVLAVEHAGVKRHLGQRAGNRCHCEGRVALGLAAPHLRVHHVVVHGVEAQQLCRHSAVERERRAVACRAAQGVAVGHAPCSLEEEHVVGEALGVGAEPQAERARHRHLEVGVARHQHAFVLLAFLYQFVEQRLYEPCYLLYLVADEEFKVYQHLVVARAPAVYLLAHVAQAARKHKLHLRVYVLHAVLDCELSALACGVDTLQLGQ